MTATLVDDADARPVVLQLAEEATIDGDTVEAIRLPSGTDDAVAAAVRVFEND